MTETAERPSPYHLVFGAESIDERLFPPIAEEAEARGVAVDDPDRFLFLTSVGRLLHAIAGDDATPSPEARSPSGDPGVASSRAADAADVADAAGPAADAALREYGRVLYHAFRFWRGGKRTEVLEAEKVRWLLDEVTRVGDWTLTTPAPAGYLQLPRNLVWASPSPGMQPEPADGFFWSLVERDAAPAELHVLMPLGVRPGRPGFSVVSATGVLDDEPHWAEADARPDGKDFETTLPGGELDRLYSVQTSAELLKLASLCFWALDPASG